MTTTSQAPIKLIEKTNDGKLLVKDDALKLLSTIDKNVAVCICVGPYRQGKSFLMNQIHKETKNGFQIGHKDDPCTHGVWMHKYPHTIKDNNGKDVTLILMDTEANIFFI